MKELYFYPTLNEDNYKDYGIEIGEFSFAFKEASLYFDDETNVLKNPTDALWNVQNNGMNVKVEVQVKNLTQLRGRDGVICSGAQIGFYIIWSNKYTMQSGKATLSTEDGMNYVLNYLFVPEQIKSVLDLELHAYVRIPDNNITVDETFLMNESGVSIGIIATRSILLNKEQLSFPICKVKEHDKPLWWVDLDWDDPTVDRFDNSVTVYLNKKFKSYPRTEKDSEFLHTIIAAVYFLIFKKLKSKDEELISTIFNGSDEFEEFSVCNVMSYFCKTFNYLTLDKLKNLPDEELLEEIQKEISATCGGTV